MNCKITARLLSPVVSDSYLPLDGAVFHYEVKDKLGEMTSAKPFEAKINPIDFLLPFEIENEGTVAWYYACSFAFWEGDTIIEDSASYSKRFNKTRADLIDFKGKGGKIDTSRGQYKNAHNKLYYRFAKSIAWYARVTDIERLRYLLSHCTALGKKRSQGWGAVRKWDIEEVDYDYSLQDKDGKPSRAIPSDSGTDLYGIRPSYWMRENKKKCTLPCV